jgi:hypothetical protein
MPVFTPGSNTQRLPTANVSGGSYRFVHQPRQKTKTGVCCDVRASRVRTYGAGREGSRVSFNRLATALDVRVEFESGPSRERRPVPVRTETIHRQRNDRVMPVFTPGSNTQRLPTANVSGGSHRFVHRPGRRKAGSIDRMSAVLSRHLEDLLNPRTPEGPSPKFSPSSKQWPIARCSTSRFLRCCSAGWLACEKHKSGKQTPPRRRATGSLISVERW